MERLAAVICASCGTGNEAARNFCVECGTRLGSVCPACGTANPAAAKFCGSCGTALAAGTSAAPVGPRSVPDTASAQPGGDDGPIAERRLVSVMFADLVGFTTLSEDRDAEETRELLSRYFETAREIVERHGGTVEKFIGDAVMAVWGTPTAHEDDAERAVRTAIELVTAVGAMEVGGQPLQARAGVLTGEAAVTIGATNQGMVAGDLVNTASRIQSAAVPGTVLVGEATYRAASGAIAFEEAGKQTLKGKAAPVPTWRAVAVVARRGGSGRAAQLEPPFVGRDEELRTLKEQFHATAREGKPRLVTIIGQAGIGKSRLGWELEKYLDGVVENIWFHEGRSPSYGEGISYWALAEMVRGRAGIAESDGPGPARERLRATLEQFVDDPVERRWIEPRLSGLLGLEPMPEVSREELFAAWRTFFERMGAQGTVLLVFWDLQWADQGLLDFIEHLLSWARSSPIFVLAEARPELLARRPGWGTTVRAATSIHLEPMADADMRLLLTGLVPGMPEQALRAIVDRAEGVPLYAVETLRMLLDRGTLRAEEGRYSLSGELPDLAVPETLHALIASRLDALEPELRTLVTDASVLGLSFTPDALAAVSGLEPAILAERLGRLVRHEMLVLDVDPRSPERGQHRFVQGVVREVAYQSLARRDRRAKHLAAARHFETLGEEELTGVLASHYLAAYHASPAGPEADALAAQARIALRAAADRATALHAPVAALGYLEQALEVTTESGEQALLHERAGEAGWLANRVSSALDHARAAEEIHARNGDRLGVLRGRTLQASVHLASHGDRPAERLLRAALEEADDLPASREVATAQAELARALMLQGSPEAISWADRVLEARSVAGPGLVIEALITKGSTLDDQGAWLEGEALLRGALTIADRLGNVSAGLRARNNLRVILEKTNLEEAMQLNREGYEIARRLGLASWVVMEVGAALVDSRELGAWDDWRAEMLEELPGAGGWYGGWYRLEDAWRDAQRGRAEEGLAILPEIERHEESQNSIQALAFDAWFRADVLVALGRWPEAINAWQHALTYSQRDPSLSFTGMLAAAAAGSPDHLDAVRAELPPATSSDPPRIAGLRAVGDTFAALLAGQWDAARAGYRRALASLELSRHGTMLARFQLAVGHGAAGRFPEAAEAAAAAETFFRERGADAFVATYRAEAAVPDRAGAPQAGAAPHRTSARSEVSKES
jgi:class 3 adenylate cyclase/tetratricopeptide (TPR) repeat protein